MSSLSNICDVKVDSASVGGTGIDSIVSLTLVAQANSVPYITLVVDAYHMSDSAGDGAGSGGSVEDASAEKSVAVYSSLRGKIGTAKLSLSVTVSYSGADSQKLSISDWPLTNVVLAPMSVGACPAVAITCKHPLCEADIVGAVVGGYTKAPDPMAVSGGDPLKAFTGCVRECVNKARESSSTLASVKSQGGAQLDEIANALLSNIEKAAGKLEGALNVKVSSLPAAGKLDTFSSAGTFMGYAEGCSGVLSTFLSDVVPECSLVVGGDYASPKLDVDKYAPWKSASASVCETDVESFKMPGCDQAPVVGAHIPAYTAAMSMNSSFHLDSANSGIKPMPIYYVPKKILGQPDFQRGHVQTFALPVWAEGAYELAMSRSGSGKSPTKSQKAGNIKIDVNFSPGGSDPGSSGGDSYANRIGDALMCTAQAYYESAYMREMTFQATLRFMVTGGGGVIAPGRTLAIKSASVSESGNTSSPAGEMVRGYVTSVVHYIDAKAATATTTVNMAYPVIGGKVPDVINDAESNALYDS